MTTFFEFGLPSPPWMAYTFCMEKTLQVYARLKEIYVGAERMGPMRSVERAEAISSRGLAGDRYAEGSGSYSRSKGVRDVTLIEAEALWRFFKSSGVDLHPALTRRNLITEGVDLNNLVGHPFSIGKVEFFAHRVCPPCSHLANLIGMPEVLPGLANSGGIYAEVLSDGCIHVGDAITVTTTAEQAADAKPDNVTS